MKTLTALLACVLALGWSTSSKAAEYEILTGDTGLACEAILCLAAAGSKPSECSRSLARYFSITATKPSRLASLRRSFLSLCPSSEPSLINSLVNGQCNPTYQQCAPAGGGPIPRPGEGNHETEIR